MDLSRLVDAFLVGLASASAAAIVAAAIALFRFLRRLDRERMKTLADVEHRQRHVLRWVKAVAYKIGVRYPLDGDVDDDDEWEEGLR